MCFFSSFVLFYALITPECMIGISCQWVILSYILSIVVISRVCALNRIKNQYEIRVWYIFVRLFVCLFCICFFFVVRRIACILYLYFICIGPTVAKNISIDLFAMFIFNAVQNRLFKCQTHDNERR